MIDPHDILEVSAECKGGGGYLTANVGDRVEVLHYQQELDPEGHRVGGWAYVRMTKDASIQGWIAHSAMDIPQTSGLPVLSVGRLMIGMLVSTVAKLSPEPNTGYLVADSGTTLEVVYVGSGDENGWIYAQRRRIDETLEPWCHEGWLKAESVQPHSVHQHGQPALLAPETCIATVDESDQLLQDEEALYAELEAVRTRCFPVTAAPRPSRPCPSAQDKPVAESIPNSAQVSSSSKPSCPFPSPPSLLKQPEVHSTRPAQGTLRLITFGLENTESGLVERCNDASGPDGGGGGWVQIEEWELRRALRAKKEPHVDLVLDARYFPDPNAQHLTRHIGVHPEIIKRIVHHRHFRGYLEDVKQKWYSVIEKNNERIEKGYMENGPRNMVVAVYCKSGKHRSVAIAECLKHIGVHVEGLKFVGPTNHLSQPRWGKSVCKGVCHECTEPSEEKEEALRLAAEIWQQCRSCW